VFNISATELLVIAIVALLILGPDKLPDAMRKLGRATRELRRITSGFEAELRDALSDAPEPPAPKTAAASHTTQPSAEPTPPANPTATATATAAAPADPPPQTPPPPPADPTDGTPESLPGETTNGASVSAAPTSAPAEGSSPSGGTIA
jgi:sec-independent protein translocase protein TatB